MKSDVATSGPNAAALNPAAWILRTAVLCATRHRQGTRGHAWPLPLGAAGAASGGRTAARDTPPDGVSGSAQTARSGARGTPGKRAGRAAPCGGPSPARDRGVALLTRDVGRAGRASAFPAASRALCGLVGNCAVLVHAGHE